MALAYLNRLIKRLCERLIFHDQDTVLSAERLDLLCKQVHALGHDQRRIHIRGISQRHGRNVWDWSQ